MIVRKFAVLLSLAALLSGGCAGPSETMQQSKQEAGKEIPVTESDAAESETEASAEPETEKTEEAKPEASETEAE